MKEQKIEVFSYVAVTSLVEVVKTSSADKITRSGQLLNEYKGVDEITGQAGNFVHPGIIIKFGSRCWQRPKKAFSTSRTRS
jgi:hypothetical protein